MTDSGRIQTPGAQRPPTAVLEPEAIIERLLGTDEPPPDLQTRLTIHRTSPDDVRDRQVIMSLDGKRLTQLFFGQTFTCDIEPGPHRLRANNTLVWKTVEFIAPAGTHVHFTCINRAPAGMMYMLAVFGVAPLFVTLRPGHPTFVHGS
jgi:hypothetical protein